MQKQLYTSLWILAIVAILFIVWIKTDIPKIPLSFLTTNLSNVINDIVLNLSYGYMSGFVIYWLTAYLPYLRRRKLIMRSVNFIVFNFTKDVVKNFLVLYIDCNEEECKKIYLFRDRMGDKYASSILLGHRLLPDDPKTNSFVYLKCMGTVAAMRIEFMKTMDSYVDYLDEKQLKALYKVTLNDFDKTVKGPHEGGLSGLNAILNSHSESYYSNGFSLYKKYVMLVLMLNDSIAPK